MAHNTRPPKSGYSLSPLSCEYFYKITALLCRLFGVVFAPEVPRVHTLHKL
jgi:hypothetical protein